MIDEASVISLGSPLENKFADYEANESYFQLVWRRFRRSKVSIVGGLIVIVLVILAIFADFVSPTDISKPDLKAAFTPPQQVHFIDHDGHFHLIPFVYNLKYTLDPKTFRPTYVEDTTKLYELHFFVQGSPYKILGLIPSTLHLYGVDQGGTVYLLGTDKQGRDLWGKVCEAGRISLSMGLIATFISIAFGSVLGVASGYYGGWIDNAMQRFTEFVSAFPQLPLFMALAALVPKTADSFSVFVAMAANFSLLSWTSP